MFFVVDRNHRAAEARDYSRSAGFKRVVDVCLQVGFLWLHSPVAAEMILEMY